METALYFPYIEVPDSVWFTQILLYWNKAATIVPDVMGAKVGLSRNMRELNDNGLLDFIAPTYPLLGRLEKNLFDFLPGHQLFHPPGDRAYTPMHREKMNDSIIYALCERGLARESDAFYGWYDVEETVAGTYTAMLAAAIAGERDAAGNPTTPTTDTPELLSYMGSPGDTPQEVFDRLRYQVIALLPVPAGPVPAADLVKFKEDHGEQLQHLRDDFDRRIISVAGISDEDLRTRNAEILTRDIQRQLKDLKKEMEARRWPQIVLLGVGGIAAVGLGVASGVVTAGASTLLLGLAAGQAAASVGGAAYTIADLVKSPRFNPSKPLAYAASVSALGRPQKEWRRLVPSR
jgi:hypothetical protein